MKFLLLTLLMSMFLAGPAMAQSRADYLREAQRAQALIRQIQSTYPTHGGGSTSHRRSTPSSYSTERRRAENTLGRLQSLASPSSPPVRPRVPAARPTYTPPPTRNRPAPPAYVAPRASRTPAITPKKQIVKKKPAPAASEHCEQTLGFLKSIVALVEKVPPPTQKTPPAKVAPDSD